MQVAVGRLELSMRVVEERQLANKPPTPTVPAFDDHIQRERARQELEAERQSWIRRTALNPRSWF